MRALLTEGERDRRGRRKPTTWRSNAALAAQDPMGPPPLECLEDLFQAKVEELAGHLGWQYNHAHVPLLDEAGWPDLMAVRERFLFAELKTSTGRLSGRQRVVLDALAAAGIEVYLWRPVDWPEIVAVFTARGHAGVVTATRVTPGKLDALARDGHIRSRAALKALKPRSEQTQQTQKKGAADDAVRPGGASVHASGPRTRVARDVASVAGDRQPHMSRRKDPGNKSLA